MKLETMTVTEPLEVRFGSNSSTYCLLVSVTNNGVLTYTLNSVPEGNYSLSLNYLVGETNKWRPRKAVEGWQGEVLEWLTDKTLSGKPVYTVKETR